MRMASLDVRAPDSEATTPGGASLEAGVEHPWMLVPGLLVIYLGFDAGGFFAGTTGVAAAAIAVLLAVRVLTAPDPRSGLTRFTVIALVGIACFAGLTLISHSWSHSSARALLSFDLAALYLVVTALHGAVRQTAERLRTMIYGLLVALAGVCAAGFLTRTLPHAFPLSADLQTPRISYPVTYWNALGMLAGLGILLAVHAASDRGARALPRMIAAGLLPGFAGALLLTFSRGSIAALAVGLVVYVVCSLRVSLLTTIVAAGPFTAIAVRTTYNASLLTSSNLAAQSTLAEGRHVAKVVGLCVLAAFALRGGLLVAERKLPQFRPPRRARLTAVAVAGAAVVVLVVSNTSYVNRQYDTFVNGTVANGLTRNRLTSVANDGRVELWRVAFKRFQAEPLRGYGAGTYALLWEHDRPDTSSVQDAHNLYLQTLAELGILGAVALAVFLMGLLLGSGRLLLSARQRPLGALAVAVLVAWGLHCAVDWDWQMPAVTAPVLALLAAAGSCATSGPRLRALAGISAGALRTRLPGRLVVAALCLAVGLEPALVAVSQADLDASVRAFDRNDCATAIERAGAAHRVVGSRPEPLEIIGYCYSRDGNARQAITTMKGAVSRDPGDWEFRYGLGIVTAAAGSNPLPALRSALRLDPHEPLIANAMHALRGKRPAARRHLASGLPLDVP
jgi:Flp pilus assembly protein TadD